jgi:hypothetical protein
MQPSTLYYTESHALSMTRFGTGLTMINDILDTPSDTTNSLLTLTTLLQKKAAEAAPHLTTKKETALKITKDIVLPRPPARAPKPASPSKPRRKRKITSKAHRVKLAKLAENTRKITAWIHLVNDDTESEEDPEVQDEKKQDKCPDYSDNHVRPKDKLHSPWPMA